MRAEIRVEALTTAAVDEPEQRWSSRASRKASAPWAGVAAGSEPALHVSWSAGSRTMPARRGGRSSGPEASASAGGRKPAQIHDGGTQGLETFRRKVHGRTTQRPVGPHGRSPKARLANAAFDRGGPVRESPAHRVPGAYPSGGVKPLLIRDGFGDLWWRLTFCTRGLPIPGMPEGPRFQWP